MPSPTPRDFSFNAADGTPLAATLFEPTEPVEAAKGAVLIAGALGVTKRFYGPFAQWLAERGYRVMTFDLRGVGASRQAMHKHSLKGLDADMLTWARVDFAAAVRHLSELNQSDPITLVGHSLGINHAGMTDAATQRRIVHAVSVAAGAGFWRDWAAPSRRTAPLMLHIAVPLLTPLLGYFPGKRLGMVGDLPGPAALQWARWCRHPEFAWGAEPDKVMPSLLSARFTMDAMSFTDDEAMTEACTRKLMTAFANARSTLHVIAPTDVGLTGIGHLGAFRQANSASLWPLMERLIRHE